jgi:hypothetical protein
MTKQRDCGHSQLIASVRSHFMERALAGWRFTHGCASASPRQVRPGQPGNHDTKPTHETALLKRLKQGSTFERMPNA